MCTLDVVSKKFYLTEPVLAKRWNLLRGFVLEDRRGKWRVTSANFRSLQLTKPLPRNPRKNLNRNPNNLPCRWKKGQGGQARASASRPEPQVNAYLYEMRGHVEQAVDKYLELSGKTKA